MGLSGIMGTKWTDYITVIQKGTIILDEGFDALKWSYNRCSGGLTAKLAYQCLSEEIVSDRKWWHSIWSWKAPHKITIFCWLALENYLLSWDNLSK